MGDVSRRVDYGGVWFGTVEADDASLSQDQRGGRCKVRIPDLHPRSSAQDLPWARVLQPGFGSSRTRRGWFVAPRVGDEVAVMFERGDPGFPVVIGWTPLGGRVPAPFRRGPRGGEYPDVSGVATRDGAGFRMTEGRDLEITVGDSGTADENGVWRRDDEHRRFETRMRMEKPRGEIEIRAKRSIVIRAGESIVFRAPRMVFAAIRSVEPDEEGNLVPTGPPPQVVTFCVDPSQGQASVVIASPGQLIAFARRRRGFESTF